MSRYIMTIVLETSEDVADELAIRDEVEQKLVEDKLIDCTDYRVVYVCTPVNLPES